MARNWWSTTWANWSIDQSLARNRPMLHHERLRPPSHDYPADEWDVIARKPRRSTWRRASCGRCCAARELTAWLGISDSNRRIRPRAT
jgi:hypothetical protein